MSLERNHCGDILSGTLPITLDIIPLVALRLFSPTGSKVNPPSLIEIIEQCFISSFGGVQSGNRIRLSS